MATPSTHVAQLLPLQTAASPLLDSGSLACLSAVTALQFVDDSDRSSNCSNSSPSPLRLLAGSGSSLSLFDVQNGGRLLARCVALGAGRRIHGLRVQRAPASDQQLVLVWGGKDVAIWELVPSDTGSDGGSLLRCLWSSPGRGDLIWDVRLLHCGDDCAHRSADDAAAALHTFDIAIGYAHDRVELLSFTSLAADAAASSTSASAAAPCSSSASLLQCVAHSVQLQCEERSLLYSMTLHGSCRHELLAVAGTVFSHILLWDASFPAVAAASTSVVAAPAAAPSRRPFARGCFETRPVLHRLTGHEGVIFRLQSSEDATRICSVSDDRSVRVWKWQRAGDEATATVPVNFRALLAPAQGSFVQQFVGYGHRARVWCCALTRNDARWPLALSASEDGSAGVWHSQTGALLGRLQGAGGGGSSRGAGLWSIALHEPSGTVALGSGDCTARIVSLRPIMRRHGLMRSQEGELNDEEEEEEGNDTTAVRQIVLHVPDMLPGSSAAAAALSASTAMPAVAATASADASPSRPPSKKARVETDSAGSTAAAADGAVAAVSTPAAPSKKVAAPKKPAPEICRELLLEADAEAESATLFMITSLGRVLRLTLDPAAAATTTTADAASADLTSATLLHHHTRSPAPLVALALSGCKRFLAIGDQRGNLLLISASTENIVEPLWLPLAYASACGFLQWLPTTVAGGRSDDASSIGVLLTGDAMGEAKVWSVRRGQEQSMQLLASQLLTFRLPVKARICSALMLPRSVTGRIGSPTVPSSSHHEAVMDDDDGADSDGDDDAMVDATQCHVGSQQLLLCGDSRGSVYLYALASLVGDEKPATQMHICAVCRLIELHDKSPVSSLVLAPISPSSRSNSDSSLLLLYSTGRNGTLVELALASTAAPSEDTWVSKHNAAAADDQYSPVVVASTLYRLWSRRVHKVPSLSCLERVWARSHESDVEDEEVIVAGFHAMDFVVYNVTRGREERRWGCGGANRSWGFQWMTRGAGVGGAGGAVEPGFIFVFARSGGEEGSSKKPAAAAAATVAADRGGEVVCFLKPATIASSASGELTLLGPGTHARLTTSMEGVSVGPGLELLLTGSEDNCVKVFALRTDLGGGDGAQKQLSSPLKCLATISDHPDVVRALAVSTEAEVRGGEGAAPSSSSLSSSIILFSGGGRDHMRATRITTRVSNAAAAEMAAQVSIESLGAVVADNDQGATHRSGATNGKTWLRSTESAAAATGIDATQERLAKLDLRIMCLTAFAVPSSWLPASTVAGHLRIVASGNSAGVVKVFLFDSQASSVGGQSTKKRKKFTLLAQSAAHHYTVLSMTHLRIGEEVLLFSGSTNGQVYVWSMRAMVEETLVRQSSATAATSALPPVESASSSSPLPLLTSFTQHQSGVDCMCAMQLPASRTTTAVDAFVLFTGGDDQSISALGGILTRPLSGAGGRSAPQLLHPWSHALPLAHTSAIKSLALDPSARRLYSIGFDQLVRVWAIEDGQPPAGTAQRNTTPAAAATAAAAPCVTLRPIGQAISEVWDVTAVRRIGSAPDSAQTQLAIAGQGLQVLQLRE